MMIRRVLSSLRRRFLKVYYRVKQIVCFDESQVIYNGRTYKSYWDEFYGDAHRSFISKIRVKFQTRKAFLQGGFRPDEFSLYGLENQKESYREQFLPQKKKDQLLISYYGAKWRSVFRVLKDKYVFYSYLKDFFNRDVTYIKDSGDRLSFLSFCNRHGKIFAKQNKGCCGSGAKEFSIKDDEQANAVFDDLISSGEWIIEELINQDPAISAFNSSSVNTVRFPSFKRDGIVKSVFPCMRFGRAGDIVDNAGHGGLTVSIDLHTGVIISDAFDEKGNVFVSHPDSGIIFRGFQIPLWEDLIDLVRRAHLALPDDQVYVAFDCALSDKGWCLVEGNWGDWILQQISLKRGLRNEFISFLND